jgi:ribosomal protein L1
MQVFNQVLLSLPKEKSNVKRVLLKKTMSKAVELDL